VVATFVVTAAYSAAVILTICKIEAFDDWTTFVIAPVDPLTLVTPPGDGVVAAQAVPFQVATCPVVAEL
jgi:hypothetical protein